MSTSSSSLLKSVDLNSLKSLIQIAIEEDKILSDVTSQVCIPKDQNSKAKFIAKEDFVICGLDLLEVIYHELKYSLKIELQKKDGDKVKVGDELAIISGSTREILSSERLCLNFLQQLSGVATKAQDVASQAPGFTVLDTRKTIPGLRDLQKYAVRVGGATNHRANLAAMILIKNNHIDALGGDLRTVLNEVKKNNSTNIPVEIEVRSESELKIALDFSPARILLDNMNDAQVAEAVKIIRARGGKILIEVSGGVTKTRLKSLQNLNVDSASMGALTNKIDSVDISLRIVK